MRKRKFLLVFITLTLVLLQTIFLREAKADSSTFEIKVASDYEIQDFLKKFIQSSVDNVKMLVDFVIKLLRDALGQNNPALPNNKHIFELKCHH
jgi:hypothetical protein